MLTLRRTVIPLNGKAKRYFIGRKALLFRAHHTSTLQAQVFELICFLIEWHSNHIWIQFPASIREVFLSTLNISSC